MGYEIEVNGERQQATPKGWSRTKGETAQVEIPASEGWFNPTYRGNMETN